MSRYPFQPCGFEIFKSHLPHVNTRVSECLHTVLHTRLSTKKGNAVHAVGDVVEKTASFFCFLDRRIIHGFLTSFRLHGQYQTSGNKLPQTLQIALSAFLYFPTKKMPPNDNRLHRSFQRACERLPPISHFSSSKSNTC